MIGLSKTRIPIFVLAILAIPVTAAFSLVHQQGQSGPTGDLSVVGEVAVNGISASSGATVLSGRTVTTAKGSSAVVSLGKLGRVEVMPETKVKVTFDRSSITTTMLDAGRVRVSSSAGTGAKATTADGTVKAVASDKNEFTVDTRCGNTLVSVTRGRVELRAGNSVKQIAAGSQDTAGTARPGCRR